MRYSTIVLFAALSLGSAPAFADRPDTHARVSGPEAKGHIAALDRRDAALQRKSMTMRIGPVERDRIAQQRHEIRKLQKELEQGRAVSSFELERALGANDVYANYRRS